jgi:hypothetical protein
MRKNCKGRELNELTTEDFVLHVHLTTADFRSSTASKHATPPTTGAADRTVKFLPSRSSGHNRESRTVVSTDCQFARHWHDAVTIAVQRAITELCEAVSEDKMTVIKNKLNLTNWTQNCVGLRTSQNLMQTAFGGSAAKLRKQLQYFHIEVPLI